MIDARGAAQGRVREIGDQLIGMSHRIHGRPEIGFEEERASLWLADALDAAGMMVERGVFDLPTAFVARAGTGPLHVAICAEYDALPGIGHACGHNMIASMALGAGLALARVADDVGLTVSVVGTPAEEVGDGGGKILLLERGAFAGVHAAMMVHPTGHDLDRAAPSYLAASRFDVRYRGKAAHASSHPERGINAADAMVVAQTAIGLLRQHIRATDRIHGIVTKGGDAPNIVPAEATASYMVRAETIDQLVEIHARVRRCFEAGALAAGATLEIAGGERPYAQVRQDAEIAALYQRNAEAIGRTFDPPGAPQEGAASTDMGNVSLALPAIHPRMGISAQGATNHQPEFAAFCATDVADRAVIDGATAMAWTAIDLATEPRVRDRLLQAGSR
jgi:amidohydrolase